MIGIGIKIQINNTIIVPTGYKCHRSGGRLEIPRIDK